MGFCDLGEKRAKYVPPSTATSEALPPKFSAVYCQGNHTNDDTISS